VVTNVDSGDAGTYSVIVDNGATTTSSSAVLTLNQPPTVAPLPDPTIELADGGALNVTISATDPEGGALTFALSEAPEGAAISSTGVVTWTPTEAQSPSTNTFTVRVTDANGASATRSFTVTVSEVNSPPVLAAIANRTNAIGTTVTFTVTATDPDVPTNTLTFSLGAGAPAGAVIDPNTGVFSWTVSGPDGASNAFTVIVTDNGSPALNHSRTFTIVAVSSVPPTTQGIQIVGGNLEVTFAGIPGNTYVVQATPSLSPPINWTPVATNVPSQTGLFKYVDAQFKNLPMRFFRAGTP